MADPAGLPSTCDNDSSCDQQRNDARTASTNIVQPTDADVLCGRGGAAQRHPGNQTYRRLVSLNQALYVTCLKTEKIKISRSIVNAIREQDGRFLEKDAANNTWYDIGDKKAVEKTSQALREKQPHIIQQLADLNNDAVAAAAAAAAATTTVDPVAVAAAAAAVDQVQLMNAVMAMQQQQQYTTMLQNNALLAQQQVLNINSMAAATTMQAAYTSADNVTASTMAAAAGLLGVTPAASTVEAHAVAQQQALAQQFSPDLYQQLLAQLSLQDNIMASTLASGPPGLSNNSSPQYQQQYFQSTLEPRPLPDCPPTASSNLEVPLAPPPRHFAPNISHHLSEINNQQGTSSEHVMPYSKLMMEGNTAVAAVNAPRYVAHNNNKGSEQQQQPSEEDYMAVMRALHDEDEGPVNFSKRRTAGVSLKASPFTKEDSPLQRVRGTRKLVVDTAADDDDCLPLPIQTTPSQHVIMNSGPHGGDPDMMRTLVAGGGAQHGMPSQPVPPEPYTAHHRHNYHPGSLAAMGGALSALETQYEHPSVQSSHDQGPPHDVSRESSSRGVPPPNGCDGGGNLRKFDRRSEFARSKTLRSSFRRLPKDRFGSNQQSNKSLMDMAMSQRSVADGMPDVHMVGSNRSLVSNLINVSMRDRKPPAVPTGSSAAVGSRGTHGDMTLSQPGVEVAALNDRVGSGAAAAAAGGATLYDNLGSSSKHSFMSMASRYSDSSTDRSIFSDLSKKIGNVSTRSFAMSEISIMDMAERRDENESSSTNKSNSDQSALEQQQQQQKPASERGFSGNVAPPPVPSDSFDALLSFESTSSEHLLASSEGWRDES